MSVTERIKRLIETEYNQSVFAEKVDLNKATVSRLISRGGQVKSDTLENICKSYPNLNARWLLTGEGPMWLTEQEVLRAAARDPEKEALQQRIEEQNEMLKRINELLEDKLNILRREVMRRDPDLAKELGLRD